MYGRIVFAIPQTATTATSRPEALTSRSMSSGSLVSIAALSRSAVVTTTASTTSDVLVIPNSRPASCASVSPRGTTTHPGQETPELGLFGRPTDLGDHRRGNKWDNTKFQTGLVFSPCSPLVSIGRHENGGVIEDGAHAERRTARDVPS